ncbi:unnamed protein product [Soboliphyme baturini]|uniref:RRM domain-containing protein n=1 Tax=Soboliphyme baturini TaxID=241478 RepID=A0A183IM78_9BILA|nr:unnamed protein product [Soboliphyme baturini]
MKFDARLRIEARRKANAMTKRLQARRLNSRVDVTNQRVVSPGDRGNVFRRAGRSGAAKRRRGNFQNLTVTVVDHGNGTAQVNRLPYFGIGKQFNQQVSRPARFARNGFANKNLFISALEDVQDQSPPRIVRAAGMAIPHASGQPCSLIVSNLNATVSKEDVEELFGSVGTLEQAYFLKQGIAIVVYSNRLQAQQAVAEFHGRELDGKPINCVLIDGDDSQEDPTNVMDDDPDVQQRAILPDRKLFNEVVKKFKHCQRNVSFTVNL